MRVIFCVLCVAMCSGPAGAQQLVSNFEACVAEATQRHTDSTMDDYSSYKCDGATAQKLAARPDECSADVRPSRIERKSKQLEDGLYLRTIWRTQVCAGMCEIRFYNDSRDPSYLCEVRRHSGGRRGAQNDDQPPPRYSRRYPIEYPPRRRWGWRPPRDYDEPGPYRRRMREIEEEPRARERWLYVEPEWRLEYRRDYRDDYYRDEDRRDYPY